MSRPSTTDVVIIGAGPYGLSVGAHLRRHGLLIAGTGYRVDLGRLPFLATSYARLLLVAGAPALSSSFEALAPDLYFLGLASAHSFGPVMRFLHGADYSARRLVVISWPRSPGTRSPAPAVQ